MGVSGLLEFLRQHFPECWVPLPASGCDHVYVDMNSVLHQCTRHCTTEAAAQNSLLLELQGLFRRYRPRQTLVLAIDGPAPLAKLHEQRIRRLKPARGGSSAGGSASTTSGASFSPLAITVGTPFLRDVDDALRSWASSNRLGLPHGIRVVVDPSSHDGEGEVKLFDALAREPPASHERDAFLIIGGDADLVLLALASPARLVLVCDPSTAGRGGSGSRAASQPTAFSTAAFRQALLQRQQAPHSSQTEALSRPDTALPPPPLPQRLQPPHPAEPPPAFLAGLQAPLPPRQPDRPPAGATPAPAHGWRPPTWTQASVQAVDVAATHTSSYRSPPDVAVDFVVLGLLSGNDYLPRLKGGYKLPLAMDAYVASAANAARTASTSNTANADGNFGSTTHPHSGRMPPARLVRVAPPADGAARGDTTARSSVELNLELRALGELLERMAAELGPAASEHTLDSSAASGEPPASPEGSIVAYLRGLLWCLTMYHERQCPHYGWTAEEVEAVPTLQELAHALTTDAATFEPLIHCPRSSQGPPSALVIPLLVLPASASAYVLPSLRHLSEDPQGELAALFAPERCATCAQMRSRLSVLSKQREEEAKAEKAERERVAAAKAEAEAEAAEVAKPALAEGGGGGGDGSRKRKLHEVEVADDAPGASQEEEELPLTQETVVAPEAEEAISPALTRVNAGQEQGQGGPGADGTAGGSSRGRSRTALQVEIAAVSAEFEEHRASTHPPIGPSERYTAVTAAVERTMAHAAAPLSYGERACVERGVPFRCTVQQLPMHARQQHHPPYHGGSGSSNWPMHAPPYNYARPYHAPPPGHQHQQHHGGMRRGASGGSNHYRQQQWHQPPRPPGGGGPW